MEEELARAQWIANYDRRPMGVIGLLFALIVCFLLAWPLSDYTEIQTVEVTRFDLDELSFWFAVIVGLSGGPPLFFRWPVPFPGKVLARLFWITLCLGIACYMTIKTDTEIVTEARHDWLEHAQLTAMLMAIIIFTRFLFAPPSAKPKKKEL
jgi:hypothetical protein